MNVTPGPNSPSVQETLTFAISYSLPSSISSIVFACIAATLLLAFLIWRGVRFCGLCCCKYARFLPDPNGLTSRDKYLKGKWIAGVKVSGVIGGLCLIAASLYGIIESSMGGHYTNNNNLVQQGWYVLGVLVTYVATTVVTLRQLMYNLNLIGVTVDMIVGITNDTLCRYEVDPLPPDVVEQATEVTSTTYDVTYAAGMTANSIYQSLVQAYEETHNTWEETTLTIWNYLVIGYLVILTLVLIGSLLFMGATIFNHTTGLFWTVTIHLFQSLLFFILCIAFTIGMASLKESCYSAEGFITASTSYPPAQALLKYYLNSNSTSTDILQILNVANINITAIERILASPIASLPLYPDILNDTNIQSRCIPTLISLTRLLSATVLNATNILGSLGQPSSLVYLTSFDVVQSNYGSTKAYLCCDVPGLLHKMYIVLTTIGWLGMVVSALGFYQISCLDRIPQRLCCACRALTPFNPFETSEEPSNQVEGEKQMEDEEQRSPPESELTMERESLGMGRNRLPSDNDNLSKVEISYSSGLRLT